MQNRSIHRLLLLSIPLALLLGFPGAGVAKRYPPEDPGDTGPWAVGHTSFEVVDGSRDDRPLPVQAWYPVDPQDAVGEPTFYELLDLVLFVLGLTSEVALDDAPITDRLFRPLVVFSHGSGGINIQSIDLVETLASHGFVVVAPNHTGNTIFDDIDGTSVPFEQSAVDRPRDVSFLIDHMLERGFDPGDPFFLRINPFAIGVTGHSFGGFTSLAMAGGFGEVAPDPRVRAILPIAPASGAFSDEELASIRVPTLLLGGTLDDTTPIEPDVTRPFGLISSRSLYRADIEGATHFHFANICDIGNALIDAGITQDLWAVLGADGLIEPFEFTCGPDAFPIGEAQRIQNLYAVSFFRRHLIFDFRYEIFLTEIYAEVVEPAVVFFRKRSDHCGVDFEIALLIPPLVWLRARRWGGRGR
jgi:predicted dienelactone hydrolase